MIRRASVVVLVACVVWLCPHEASARGQWGSHHLSVGTDSLTWVIDGYSVIATFEHQALPSLRVHTELFGIEVPASILDAHTPNQGEGWRRRIHGAFMFSIDHHPFPALKGLHWGAGFNLQHSTVSRVASSAVAAYATFEPIVRLGYQWFPLGTSGLFLAPYVALGFPLHLNEPDPIDGQHYEEAAVLPVGSVQVGWRFPI